MPDIATVGDATGFGVRERIWRSASVVAPQLGGWLVAEASTAAVFHVGGAFALTGAVAFLVVHVRVHGAGALGERRERRRNAHGVVRTAPNRQFGR